MTNTGADFGATVNGPIRLPMWDRNGKQIEVNQADAAYWQSMGFSLAPLDPAAALVEALASHQALGEAIRLYAEGCIRDGVVDRADDAELAALRTAVQLFGDSLGKLTTAIDATYPRVEGDPVVLVDDAGHERHVDPAQVAEYEAKGWAPK